MSDFPYHMNARIKAINFFRKFLRYSFIEKFLILLNQKFLKARKLVPPEYLYSPKSFRVVVRDDVTYRLDLSSVIDHSLYFFNRYFTPLEFFQLIKENSIVLDIGANIGTVALRAAAIAKKGHVYAFEPDTGNYNSLRFNIDLNSFENITPVKKAIGATPQQSKLFKVNRYNTGMNRILSSSDGFRDFEWISVVTLDEEIARLKLDRIDLIKIDVEGYELNVLQGARLVIEKFHPLIVIEVIEVNLKNNGQTSAEVIQFLKGLGYSFIDLKTGKPLMNEHHLETDVLCYADNNPLMK
jgi:FkbM family methyltransferase